MKRFIVLSAIAIIAASGIAYAGFQNPRTAVEFFTGHSHENGETVKAPQHSGGTDRYGCHNASVPYHCH